jgi:hypothetical protein
MVLLVVNLVSSLPVYVIKFSEYGVDANHFTTHSYQYYWTMSIAYVRGNVPAVILMLMWTVVISVMVLFVAKDAPLRHFVANSNNPSRRQISRISRDSSVSTHQKPWDSRITYALIFSANAIVVGSVNGMYIYSIEQVLSPGIHLGIQIAVALFKVGWNMIIVPQLVKPMKTPSKIVEVELMLVVFNNIVIPSFITAFTSPACFQVGAFMFQTYLEMSDDCVLILLSAYPPSH